MGIRSFMGAALANLCCQNSLKSHFPCALKELEKIPKLMDHALWVININ